MKKKKKYNIAFIPVNHAAKFVEMSNRFISLVDAYLPGDNSISHLTVCQFMAEEKNVMKLWVEVCNALQQKTINLIFTEFSYLTFNNEIWWISLLPEQTERLHEIHRLVASIIKHPLNYSYDEYDPHVTLISTRHADCEEFVNEVASDCDIIEDKFVLALGNCDHVGQITDVLAVSEVVTQSVH
jgi:2'-5' RNA ligase